MGQKVNPIGFRVGVNRTWDSRWFAEKNQFGLTLLEDVKIRKYLKKSLYFSGVPRIEIERAGEKIKIIIHTARPGLVIGRKGAEIDRLKDAVIGMTQKEIEIDIKEVKRPELSAQLVAENIAMQLEKRVSFRRAMKKSVSTTMGSGADGIKVRCAGRLGGAEMSRVESYKEGRTPLHTLKSKIDYGLAVAKTTYGTIGVKVWICLGEQLSLDEKEGEA